MSEGAALTPHAVRARHCPFSSSFPFPPPTPPPPPETQGLRTSSGAGCAGGKAEGSLRALVGGRQAPGELPAALMSQAEGLARPADIPSRTKSNAFPSATAHRPRKPPWRWEQGGEREGEGSGQGPGVSCAQRNELLGASAISFPWSCGSSG